MFTSFLYQQLNDNEKSTQKQQTCIFDFSRQCFIFYRSPKTFSLDTMLTKETSNLKYVKTSFSQLFKNFCKTHRKSPVPESLS